MKFAAAALTAIVGWTLLAAEANASPYSEAYRAAFAATLADPGDLDRLFAFAEIAVREGDYEGAIGALERLLIAEGDVPAVQVELSALYLRIGALDQARAHALAARATPDEGLRARADALLTLAERRQQRHRLGGGISIGLGYRDNVTLVPDASSVTIGGQTIEVPDALQPRADGNAFAAGAVTYSTDLARSMGLTLEAALAGSYAQQFVETDYDLGTLGLAVGPRLRLGSEERGGSLWVFGLGNGTLLGRSPYAAGGGGGASLSVPLFDWLWTDVVVEAGHRWFFDSDSNTTAAGQTGLTARASGQLRWRLFDHLWLLTGGYAQTVRAVEATAARSVHGARGGLSIPFVSPLSTTARAGSVDLMFGYGSTTYDASDIEPTAGFVRTDDELRYTAFASLPIGAAFGAYASGSYVDHRSDIPLYVYTAISAAAGMSYTY